ncbi:DUF4442 domain-containing protein [Marinicella litoralis]|nr:DUF4442 domain-containing protein [Marinicella litoralis]
MNNNLESAGQNLLKTWRKLHQKPFGKFLFKQIIAKKIPYTGSIKADVQKLQPGLCEVALKFRKANTNHLNSVHALALSNLGEFTGGLAVMTGLPSHIRGIVTHISTEYLKKARGHLIAIAEVQIPEITVPKTSHTIQANIYDSDNDLVSIVTVTWLLSPKDKIQ